MSQRQGKKTPPSKRKPKPEPPKKRTDVQAVYRPDELLPPADDAAPDALDTDEDPTDSDVEAADEDPVSDEETDADVDEDEGDDDDGYGESSDEEDAAKIEQPVERTRDPDEAVIAEEAIHHYTEYTTNQFQKAMRGELRRFRHWVASHPNPAEFNNPAFFQQAGSAFLQALVGQLGGASSPVMDALLPQLQQIEQSAATMEDMPDFLRTLEQSLNLTSDTLNNSLPTVLAPYWRELTEKGYEGELNFVPLLHSLGVPHSTIGHQRIASRRVAAKMIAAGKPRAGQKAYSGEYKELDDIDATEHEHEHGTTKAEDLIEHEEQRRLRIGDEGGNPKSGRR